MFQDNDDYIWQSVANRAGQNGWPNKRRTPKVVDVDSLQSKPVDKMTKVEVCLALLIPIIIVLNLLEARRLCREHA